MFWKVAYSVRVSSWLILIFLCSSPGSGQTSPTEYGFADRQGAWNHPRYALEMSLEDGLQIISAALETRHSLFSGEDCSHLVHKIYEKAGYPYTYATSAEIYAGIAQFQLIRDPQPGDLVVWRGHVGLVVNPATKAFFSALHLGRGVERYDPPYWVHRGRPKFYRYIKGSAPVSVAWMRQQR